MVITLFILLSYLSYSVEDHDIHVSVNEIAITDQGVELILKTFLDDLQIAVGLESGAELPEGYTSSDELIAKYISETISINYNGADVPLTVEDISASPNAVWITLHSNGNLNLTKGILEFHSTFLTEVYDDQNNMVKVATSSGMKSVLLDDDKTHLMVEL